MSSRRLLAVTIPLLLAPSAILGASLTEIVKRAEDADKHVSYRGVKTAAINVGGRTTIATLKIIHLRPDKTRTQYFAPDQLAGTIVIQNGRDAWRFHPDERAWEPMFMCSSRLMDTCHRVAFENYDIKMLDQDEVAGRPTYVVYAAPRQRDETAHRMWIDREHYLVMGTQAEASNGKVLSYSRFKSVEINPDDISPSVFKVSGKIKPASCQPGQPQFSIAKPTYIPSRYKLVGKGCLTIDKYTCSHLQFSNGVNSISLFQRKATKDSPAVRVPSKTTTVLTWTRAGMQFTLMGDVPRAELQKMANSVK